MLKNRSLPLLVTAAVIEDGGEILIAQRRETDRIEPGKWEFPGGKVEFGETPEECLAREIREELNLEISVGPLLTLSSHVYRSEPAPLHVVLLFYRCSLQSERESLKHIAVQSTAWVMSKNRGNYVFAAADVPVLEEVFRIVGDAKIR